MQENIRQMKSLLTDAWRYYGAEWWAKNGERDEDELSDDEMALKLFWSDIKDIVKKPQDSKHPLILWERVGILEQQVDKLITALPEMQEAQKGFEKDARELRQMTHLERDNVRKLIREVIQDTFTSGMEDWDV
jgi:hypothetical protein